MTTSSSTGEIQRKLTVATVCGKIGRMAADEAPRAVMHIYGMATGTKRGETSFGPWAGLTGQFEAVNLENGEVSISPIAILPEPMNTLLAARVDAGDPVQFAYEIGVKFSEKGSAGYEYTTKELVKQTANDPLADLRSAIKALPAPAPVAEEAAKGKGKAK